MQISAKTFVWLQTYKYCAIITRGILQEMPIHKRSTEWIQNFGIKK